MRDAAREQRDEQLRAEAAALAADEEDRAEAAQVLRDMEPLRVVDAALRLVLPR